MDKSGAVMAKRLSDVFDPYNDEHALSYYVCRATGEFPLVAFPDEVWFDPDWYEKIEDKLASAPCSMKVKKVLKEYNRILEVIDNIQFPDYTIHVVPYGEQFILYVTYDEKCVITGELKEQRGRSWLFPHGQTNGQIVQTAFKAILTSFEHRTREHFLYKNKPVLQPHMDVDKLVEILDAK